MAYVYRHIRLDTNEPFYIGIGSDNTFKRAYEFSSGRNSLWKNIKNKTNIEVEIIIDDITWEQACEKEIEFIKLYGRKDLNEGMLCNMTDGGEGSVNIIVSEETRKKLSERGKGRRMTEAACEKIALSKIGKPRSEETKEKLKQFKGINSSGWVPVINKITLEIFSTIKEAAYSENIEVALLIKYLNGKYSTKTHKVMNFEKITREEYFELLKAKK